MPMDDADFAAELEALLADGQKIAAVKLYRDRTGAGLREAKEAVEALEAGEPLPALPVTPADSSDLEDQIVALMREGNKIAAIKLYRERTGTGLKEAKDAVEAIARERGLGTSSGGGCLGAILFAAALLAASAVAA